MSEFFGFMFQVTVVFVVLWYFGLNFFKHSHYISAWWEKRKLHKLAEKNKDKVVNIAEVFKKEFGFLETPEYVKGRLDEIKSALKGDESDHVLLNALEFIFLVDELKTQVLKTDRGVYIVSRKNINELIMSQERGVLYYARKMREYALQFLPKEGEPIVLEADEVLYWVRNGMLKRPAAEEGNRVFRLRTGVEEIYLNMKEDFIEPHYSLSIVSHTDFLKIKNRREQITKKQKSKAVLEPEDKLVEGVSVLFSDNTKRMKVGNTVIVTGGNGKTWKEDLNGNIIESDEMQPKSGGGYSKDGSIAKEAFIKKEAEESQGEMSTDIPDAKMPEQLIFHKKEESTDPGKQEEQAATKKSSEAMGEPEEERPFVCSSYQEALSKILSNKRGKSLFVSRLARAALPSVFRSGKSVYVSEKHFVKIFSEHLDPLAKQAFEAELLSASGKVNAKLLFEIYRILQEGDVLRFGKGGKRSSAISFMHNGKSYTVKSLMLNSEFVPNHEKIEEISPEEFSREEQKACDFWISIDPREERVAIGGEARAKVGGTSVSLSFSKKQAGSPKETPGFTQECEPPVESKSGEESKSLSHSVEKENTAQKKPVEVAFVKKTPAEKKKTAATEKKKKQRMGYDTFIEKFCTDQWLLDDAMFVKQKNDCEQGYFSLSFEEGDIETANVCFGFKAFRNKLLPFLEKENVEYRDSRSFFNAFLRDGGKGDVSVKYFHTHPDDTVIKAKVATIKIPVSKLEGRRLDIGIAGGYRMSEIERVAKEAEQIGDGALKERLDRLSAAIQSGNYIDCEEKE
jgi:hypothetical protein